MFALAGARIVTPRRVLDPGWLTFAGERIVSVGAGDPPAVDGTVFDLSGRYVLPGFVDLHMHGGGGAQITTDDPDEILRAIPPLPRPPPLPATGRRVRWPASSPMSWTRWRRRSVRSPGSSTPIRTARSPAFTSKDRS